MKYSAMEHCGIGIDFGTTNSALACFTKQEATLARFSLNGQDTTAFRSVLYLSNDDDVPAHEAIYAGPQAIEQYLADCGTGRFIQSLKSFLSSTSFSTTRIRGVSFTLEDLIARILVPLRESAEKQFGTLCGPVVVGRPVKFVHQTDEQSEHRAVERLTRAFVLAGFSDVRFVYEPVAAAYAYDRRVNASELLLVGDFGGGTSDFCVIEMTPDSGIDSAGGRIVATGGVGCAGDALDGHLIMKRVAPELGLGTTYRSMGGKVLPVPHWIYAMVSSWHRLSFLRDRANLKTIYEIMCAAEEPDRIEALYEIVAQNLGFHLYSSINECKATLSSSERSRFQFQQHGIELEARVLRDEFNGWIADDIQAMASALDDTLARAEVKPERIDRVFLTGGTSLVPAVREVFQRRFSPEKIACGKEFTAVVSGLARMAFLQR